MASGKMAVLATERMADLDLEEEACTVVNWVVVNTERAAVAAMAVPERVVVGAVVLVRVGACEAEGGLEGAKALEVEARAVAAAEVGVGGMVVGWVAALEAVVHGVELEAVGEVVAAATVTLVEVKVGVGALVAVDTAMEEAVARVRGMVGVTMEVEPGVVMTVAVGISAVQQEAMRGTAALVRVKVVASMTRCRQPARRTRLDA